MGREYGVGVDCIEKDAFTNNLDTNTVVHSL